MQQLLDNLRALGRVRLLILGGVGIALILVTFVGLSMAFSPVMKPVFSGLSPSGAARIVTELEQAGFQTRVSQDGSVVSVPQQDVPRARMRAAEAGLASEGAPGWELFDTAGGLGMNSFLQQVTHRRALEGEIARSIRTLDAVAAARVHLVLPERESFTRQRPAPSASVVVRADRGSALSRREAQSIQSLVAAAVPRLDTDGVTVLSATGETILSPETGTRDAGLGETHKLRMEDRLSDRIEKILSARVGSGNARVQVALDLSQRRERIVSESFDPDTRVVRESRTREETRSETQDAREVGVANEIPQALGGDAAQEAGSRSAVLDEDVIYEIGSTRRETVIEPGEVKRMSVAVIVNEIRNVADDGTVSWVARSDEELARLRDLVVNAAGLDMSRGDTVSIETLEFAGPEMLAELPAPSPIADTLARNAPLGLRLLFALAIVGLVLHLGLRPALRQMRPSEPLPAPDAEPAPAIVADGESAAGAPVAPPAGAAGSLTDETGEEYVRIAAVDGQVRRRRLEAAGALVQADEAAALGVLRGWMGADTTAQTAQEAG